MIKALLAIAGVGVTSWLFVMNYQLTQTNRNLRRVIKIMQMARTDSRVVRERDNGELFLGDPND